MIFIRSSKSKKVAFRNFVFELNSSCNHRCVYCYNFWKNNSYPKGTSNMDMWRDVIKKLKEETNIKLVSLSGGEPFLFPEIADLVKLLVKEGVEVNIITNGSMLTQDVAKKLIKARTSVFEISLPAHTPELHRAIKNSDDFYKVLDGIANVTSNNGKVVTVFVATKKNIDYVKEALDLSIVLGARAFMFNRINLATTKHIDLIPSREQLDVALTYLNNFAHEYEFPIICSVPIAPCVIDMSKYKSLSHGYCPKDEFSMYTTIDYLGNVRYCNHTPQVLGNILKNSFSEIMSSKERVQFKGALPTKCRKCEYVSICGGSCKASGLACYGSAEKLDPFVEVLSDSVSNEQEI